MKKFYWKKDAFKPSKSKKQLLTRIIILNFFRKSINKYFNILSISWDSFGFLELVVVLNLTLVFPLKEK